MKKLILMLSFCLAAPLALANQLILNTDLSPDTVAAWTEAIDGFKAENPDIEVLWNNFDHEAYKTAIRNFLTADDAAPDIANWYAGNRMAPFVEAGLFDDVSDVWQEHGLSTTLKSSEASMTIDGKQWGVPYTYYQWGIYYRKDIFANLGIDVPKTWSELMAAQDTLVANGVTPFTIGTKYLWTAAGVFDYLNLRTNGYEFHMDLTSGKVPYTDPRVVKVFDHWEQMKFIDNHAALDWQQGLTPLVNGEAAMYVMGNFAVNPLRDAGLTNNQLGFMQFPVITPGIPLAEDAPTDTIHIPSKAKNKANARKFLAYMARAGVQTRMNASLNQLPVNSGSEVPADDPFLVAGFDMLSNAYALAQFYDRDAPAAMAKAGMEGFQEFMVKPERKMRILERLEKARQRNY